MTREDLLYLWEVKLSIRSGDTVDSLDKIEMVMLFEEEFNTEVPIEIGQRISSTDLAVSEIAIMLTQLKG